MAGILSRWALSVRRQPLGPSRLLGPACRCLCLCALFFWSPKRLRNCPWKINAKDRGSLIAERCSVPPKTHHCTIWKELELCEGNVLFEICTRRFCQETEPFLVEIQFPSFPLASPFSSRFSFSFECVDSVLPYHS